MSSSIDVGTIETVSEEAGKRKKRKRSSTLSGGNNPGNGGRKRGGGGGGNGGDGGDDQNNKSAYREIEPFRPEKIRIAGGFTILVVLMTFGGLIGTYIVLFNNKDLEWRPFALPIQVWISSVLIILSSISYKIAQSRLNKDFQQSAKKWLLATTVLGAMFISSQLLSWLHLVRLGVYVKSNPYAGLFYILTAVHVIHVLGGICALGYVILRVWHETDSEAEKFRRKSIANVVGWYWHFMDGLWIVLFVLLGFFK